MTPAQQRRIRRRIHRLEQRLAWNRKLRNAWSVWNESKHGRARAFMREIIADNPDISDSDLIEELCQKLDDLLEFDGIRETISDIGIRLFAALAVAALRHGPTWLDHGAEKLAARIRELKQSLPQPPVAGDRGLGDDLSFGGGADAEVRLLMELGLDPEFID